MTDGHHDPGADLDARLAALGDTPLPLAGAHAARLRGRERTRRARAVLGGSGAVAALLAVTAAAVLPGGGSTTAPEDGTLSIPTSAPTRAEGPVAAALLDADDLRLLGGDASWAARRTDDAPFSVLPENCGGARAFTTAVPRNGDTGTGLRYLDGDLAGAPVVLGHQVLSFGDEDTATTALARLVDAVDSCADDGASTELTPDAPTASATRLFGRQPAEDGDGAFVVERLGAVLSVVRLQPSTAGVDPAVADLAAAEVRAAGLVRDATPSAPTTTRSTAPGAPLDLTTASRSRRPPAASGDSG